MFSRESAVSAGLRCSLSLPGDAGADHIIRGRERGRQTDRQRQRQTDRDRSRDRERNWGEGREMERGRSVENGETERGGRREGEGGEKGRLGGWGGGGSLKRERPIGRELRDMFSRQNAVSAGLRCSLALPGDAGA